MIPSMNLHFSNMPMRMMMRREQRRGIYELVFPTPPCNVSRCQKSRLPTLLSSPLTRSRRQAPLSVPLMTSWPNSEKPRSPTPSSWNTRQQLLAPSIYGTSWRITPTFSMPKTLASPRRSMPAPLLETQLHLHHPRPRQLQIQTNVRQQQQKRPHQKIRCSVTILSATQHKAMRSFSAAIWRWMQHRLRLSTLTAERLMPALQV